MFASTLGAVFAPRSRALLAPDLGQGLYAPPGQGLPRPRPGDMFASTLGAVFAPRSRALLAPDLGQGLYAPPDQGLPRPRPGDIFASTLGAVFAPNHGMSSHPIMVSISEIQLCAMSSDIITDTLVPISITNIKT